MANPRSLALSTLIAGIPATLFVSSLWPYSQDRSSLSFNELEAASRRKSSTDASPPPAASNAAAVITLHANDGPAAVELQKRALLARPTEPVVLRDEFKTNPENYDPGPGRYIDLYAGRSGALSPWARPEDAQVTTVLSSADQQPVLHVWVPSVRVSRGTAVSIHAALRDEQGRPVPATRIRANVSCDDGATVELDSLAASPSADHDYELNYLSTGEGDGVETCNYVVTATGSLEGAFERHVLGSFFIHAPIAILDLKHAASRLEEGNLVLTVPVTVASAGSYHLYGELWAGVDGTVPVAVAQERFENWQIGQQQARIVFGGLVIRDSRHDGPYTLRNLRFRRVDVEPFVEAAPVALVMKTPAWTATEFH